jgi:hypothetical protein
MFTRPNHLFLSWVKSIQSMPFHPISLRSFFLLPSYLCLGLPSGLFPSRFPTVILNTFPPPPCTIFPAPPLPLVVIMLQFTIMWGTSYRINIQQTQKFYTKIPVCVKQYSTASHTTKEEWWHSKQINMYCLMKPWGGTDDTSSTAKLQL